jgi:hypothetical protein
MKNLMQGFSTMSRRTLQMQRIQVWSAEKRELPGKHWLEADHTEIGIVSCDMRIPLTPGVSFE